MIDKRIKKSQVVELNFRVKLSDPDAWTSFYSELSAHSKITDVKLDKE